jgi:carboxyl-terminal processing protease
LNKTTNLNPSTHRKIEIWQPFLLSLAVVIGMIMGVKFSDKSLGDMIQKVPGSLEMGNGRVEDIIRFVENKYVDKLDSDSLIEAAVQSIMSSLDPHSVYISPDQLELVNEQMQGSFEGLGLETLVVNNELAVVSLVEDGPASQAGLAIRDRILSVNGDTLKADLLTFEYVSSHLQGAKGDTLALAVLRDSTHINFKIVIDDVLIPSVEAAYEIEPGIAYIKLKRFSAKSYAEFMEALEPLIKEKSSMDLIIDLKDNPGGYLPETTKILGQLFPEKGRLLVYTQGKNSKLTEYKTNGQTFYEVGDVVVLINEYSASGSEILAGAIQDWDRGLVIGRRSFGKGLVQEQFSLSNGGAIRLTVSRYYTPSGRSIQKPYDHVNGYLEDLDNRKQNGELFNGQDFKSEDSIVYYTKILNRKMIGGGGIIPDILVPVDSSYYLNAYHKLRKDMASFCFKYYEDNLLEFSTLEEVSFLNNWMPSQQMIDSFWAFNNDLSIKYQLQAIPNFPNFLKNQLKGAFAKQLFSEELRVKVENKYNPDIQKSLEIINLQDIMTEYTSVE